MPMVIGLLARLLPFEIHKPEAKGCLLPNVQSSGDLEGRQKFARDAFILNASDNSAQQHASFLPAGIAFPVEPACVASDNVDPARLSDQPRVVERWLACPVGGEHARHTPKGRADEDMERERGLQMVHELEPERSDKIDAEPSVASSPCGLHG